MKMTTATNRVWCGIVFTDEEWASWQSGKGSLANTINNILECGLPLLERVKAGDTLTPGENAIMERIEQVVKASKEFGDVSATCNDKLLKAFDFTTA